MRALELVDGKKRCTGCGQWLPASEFYPRPQRRDGEGLTSKCKGCERTRRIEDAEKRREYHRAHYQANRQRYLDYGLRVLGLTREQYQVLWDAQNGICAMCGQPETARNPRGEIKLLAVDHNHACCPGKRSCGRCVRGLLCQRCNTSLGLLEDSVDLLMQGAAYLLGRTNLIEGAARVGI